MTTQELAAIGRVYKRALTRHHNEQAAGLRDGSVKQTRRMYLAAENLRKWTGAYARAIEDYNRERARARQEEKIRAAVARINAIGSRIFQRENPED